DPLEARDERKLVRHIDEEIGKYLHQIARAGYERVIGTSGTILSLGAVASAAGGLPEDAPLRNRRFTAKQIRRARKDLVALDLEERLRIPGLEPRRADLAIAGAILLDEILRRLGAEEITLCDLSLREGLVLDYIARHRKEIAQADRYPDVRRRSVFELAERCNYFPEHSQHVAILRVAESLARSHAQTVTGLVLHDRGDDDLLQVRTSGDAELELWAALRHAAPFERLAGKPLRIEVGRVLPDPARSDSYAEQPDTTARVPRQAVRRRGDRRLRQNDAARTAGEVVERRRPPRVRHRMELVRPRQGGDENRQEEERAHPDDVQPAARDRLR